ncbi:MAG: hypothetical protein E7H39_06190 [Clostridium sp.]|nr:hypothetical protein [Clostridium sp.]
MNGLFKKFIEFAIGNGVVLLLGFISYDSHCNDGNRSSIHKILL